MGPHLHILEGPKRRESTTRAIIKIEVVEASFCFVVTKTWNIYVHVSLRLSKNSNPYLWNSQLKSDLTFDEIKDC